MKRPERPAIRYPGGKWKLAEWVCAHFGPHRVFVDAFGGGGSITLSKKRSEVEVLNDINSEVFNFFRVLQSPRKLQQLIELLEVTPYAREEYMASLIEKKDRSMVEKARVFFIRSIMSFNAAKSQVNLSSGFKASTSFHHNPARLWTDYRKNLAEISERLMGVIIESMEYDRLLIQHDSDNTLSYLDPPYLLEARKRNRQIYQHDLRTEKEHLEILSTATSLVGSVIISHYPNDLYSDILLAEGWKMKTQNSVTSAALAGQSNQTEAIYLNPKAWDHVSQKTLF